MDRRTVLLSVGVAALVDLYNLREARADAMADAKKSGTLIIGMEAAYVPYEYLKAGKVIGYDCDIAAVLCDKLDVRPRFIDTVWAGIIPALYSGKFDCIISGMTITAAREQKVLFSMPYADASNAILVRATDGDVSSAADLSGKTVGVQLGSAAAHVIQTYAATLKAAGKPGYAHVKDYDHYPEAYEDLVNKRIDAVVSSVSSLIVVMRGAPRCFRIVAGIPGGDAYSGMAFRQQDTNLRDFANTTLATMKTDGTLAKLQEKWFGGTMVTPNTVAEGLP